MIGKWIVIFGVLVILVGVVVWLIESLGLPLGRLPGDIRMRGFHFPIVTCILVSVVLTVLLNLVLWFFRR